MSYGTGPYGFGAPYGGAMGTTTIARAWATSTRTIHVETSAPARAVDSFDAGDALNPLTWLVNRTDTMEAFTPINVTADSSAMAFEVEILEPLASHNVVHRIGSTTLLSASGAVLTAPYQALFTGMVVTIDPIGSIRRRPLVRDLANPSRGNPLTGAPVSAILISGGDFAGEIDAAVTRKGLLRRLTTPKGSIRGLPNYGVTYSVKQPFPTGGDREALRVDLEKQSLQEPGVKKAKATITASPGGVFLIRITAKMVGAQLNIALRRDASGNFMTV